ncbi:ABC transporter permease [Candidatus Bathyarchaeota archaeon]|nr:ABC transporter permease [Candidatus Bathyarchaeota archaeon]
MRLQRVLALTKKELKKTYREPTVLFMIFLFPVVFVLAFGASFGGLGEKQPIYTIGVVNLDQVNIANFTQLFIGALSSTEILSLQVYANNQTAQSDLSQGKVQAIIIIPGNFSRSLASYYATPEDSSRWINTTVLLYVDKGSIAATQVIPPIIQQVLNAFTEQTQRQISTPISLQIASFVETVRFSAFEFMAPGMFTFASIYIIMIVAQAFTEDRENGVMKRIRITPTTPTEFMSSQVLAYMLIALIQAILVFTTMYFIGFKPNVDFATYALAFTLVLIFSLSNVGFGLITATIAKTPNSATGLSFLFLLPQLFLGTFVGASLSSTAQIASKFVPSYYVTDALTSLFLRKATITSSTILLDFTVVSVSCVAILAIGIILYAKYYKI